MESDWGRVKDMIFTIEGGGWRDWSHQMSTAEKYASGNHPDSSMEGIGEVNATVQSCEVLN